MRLPLDGTAWARSATQPRQEGLRRHAGAARHQSRGGGRGVRDLRGAVGLREIHAAADHRRARGQFGRRGEDRRAAGGCGAAGQARHRHGVPDLRALSAPDGEGQHVGRAEAGRHAAEQIETRVAEASAHAVARPISEAPPGGAERRPAAARRGGPGDRAGVRSCSCSTSRSPTSTRRCASTCASRSPGCIANSRRR